MALSRRQVLWMGAGAIGALVIGWGVAPPRARLFHDLFAAPDTQAVAINAWLRIGADDTVTLFMPHCEMGQGVHTGLAMLLAEELECRLDQIRIEDAPIHPVYNNLVVGVDGLPFHPDGEGLGKRLAEHLTAKVIREGGLMVTGGSSSIRDLHLLLRTAGAMARETLREGAAAWWQVPAAQIRVEAGRLLHAQGTATSFGELVAAVGRSLQAPRQLPALKSAESWTQVGGSPLRLDSAAKTDGSARFAGDLREPGMGYVAIRLLPGLDGEIEQLTSEAARAMPGVRDVQILQAAAGTVAGIAVLADRRWRAERAAATIEWQLRPGASATVDDRSLRSELLGRLQNDADASVFLRRGRLRQLQGRDPTRVAEYSVPYLAHAPMETPSCAIKLHSASATLPARAELWVATQIPGRARAAAAKRLRLEPAAVRVHNLYAGGSFGRRLELDFIDQAAQLAVNHPDVLLQCQWSRTDDLRHDFYRPMAVARLEGWLDEDGVIQGLTAHSVSQSIVAQALPRVFGGGPGTPTGFDKTQVEGSFDQAYDIAYQRVSHTSVELPVPVGFWRAVGHSQQAFFLETFIDELAQAANADPIEFRLAHLQHQPRHREVLERLRERSAWGSISVAADGAPIARGVAINRSFGSIVGQVHEVSLDAVGRPRLHRVIVVMDCGQVVHPGMVEQQLHGAVVYALSAALRGEVPIREGVVQLQNFDDYPMLRMSETPVIEVHLVPSQAESGGVGEPGLPPTAPALANALAKLTGIRPRRLPLLDASGIFRGLSAGA